jgi:polyisoprenoid-binding protein YceI
MKANAKMLIPLMVAGLITGFGKSAAGQLWYTKTGSVNFYSHTSIEDIRATNQEVVSFLNEADGELQFQVLIKAFRFPKATMQEHFNSADYMDSDKFPKAAFKARITNLALINFAKDGNYPAEVAGEMTMHGVTKPVKIQGTLAIANGRPVVRATFMVKRLDYGIKVPGFNASKIAEQIEVTVQCNYEPYQK